MRIRSWTTADDPGAGAGGDPTSRRDTYFVDGHQVDKAEYVRVERACGFRNTRGEPDEPATSLFGGVDGDGVRHEGRMGFLAPSRREHRMGAP